MQRRTRLIAAALAATTALGLVPSAPSAAAPTPARLHWFGPNGALHNTESFTPPGATPVVGSFDAEEGQDIIWYTPGAGGDAFWSSNEDGTFTASALSISGTYTPHVGQFAGNDKGDDILWYSATGASQLWDYERDVDVALIKTSLPTVTGSGKVLVGDFTTDGTTDVIRYRAGSGTEAWWDFDVVDDGAPAAFTTRPLAVNGTYTPVLGSFFRDDLAGDYGTDILWYAPGAAADSLWDFDTHGLHTANPISINGTFTPLVGRWMASPADQILWYAPGAAADSLWSFGTDHAVTKKGLTINGTFTPYTCACIDSGAGDRDDILWHGVGAATDVIWSNKGTTFAPQSLAYAGSNIPGARLTAWSPGGDFDQILLSHG